MAHTKQSRPCPRWPSHTRARPRRLVLRATSHDIYQTVAICVNTCYSIGASFSARERLSVILLPSYTRNILPVTTSRRDNFFYLRLFPLLTRRQQALARSQNPIRQSILSRDIPETVPTPRLDVIKAFRPSHSSSDHDKRPFPLRLLHYSSTYYLPSCLPGTTLEPAGFSYREQVNRHHAHASSSRLATTYDPVSSNLVSTRATHTPLHSSIIGHCYVLHRQSSLWRAPRLSLEP